MIEFDLRYNELINSDSFLQFYYEIIENLEANNLLSKRIQRIVFTDDYINLVNELIKENIAKHHSIKVEREYFSICKIIDYKSSVILVFDINYFNPNKKSLNEKFIGLIINVKVSEDLSKLYDMELKITESNSFNEIVEFLFRNWAVYVLTNQNLRKLNLHSTIKSDDTSEIFVDTFKKNIKKLHFKYQDDFDLLNFQMQVIQSINELLVRLIDLKFEGGKFLNLKEFELIFPKFVDEIILQCNDIEEKKVDFSNIKNYLFALLDKCYLKVVSSSPFQLEITENPIKLFKNSLIDTDDRIVAFIDILGFSDKINEYDGDPQSNILKELYDALNESIELAIEQIIKNDQSSDIKDVLDYKMFSDCICISLPFHNSYLNFQIQYNYLSLIVKTYQLSMMQKGFYLRGGISIGSYYSDSKMIFSGGLVKAYKIESSINYPVIAVDKMLVERFYKNYEEFKNNQFSWDMNLVTPKSNKSIYFLNPFDLLDKFHNNLNFVDSVLGELINDSSNEDVLTKNLLKLSKDIIMPINDLAKLSLNESNIIEIKEEILALVLFELEKHYNSYKLISILDRFNFRVLQKKKTLSFSKMKIIKKYEFLRDFIEWSLKRNKNFILYQRIEQ